MRVSPGHVIQFATSLAVVLSGCSDDGGNTTITFAGGPSPLAFVAAQVADGSWKEIAPSNGRYSFTAPGPTYGIVAVCGDDNFAAITVLQATAAETTAPGIECELDGELVATLNGTITGTGGQGVSVNVASYALDQPGDAPYSAMAPAGTWDVFVSLHPAPLETSRMIRRDGVTLSANAPTVANFDFTLEGFQPEYRSAMMEGLAADDVVSVTNILHNQSGGTSFTVTEFPAPSYQALPASELRGDDIQILTATASRRDGSASRGWRRWFTTPEEFSLPLPAMPPPSLVESESATPYLLMRGSIPSGVDVDLYDFMYAQTRADRRMTWTATLSRGYRDTVNPSTYTLPDLSALAGFEPNWGLTPGMSVDWQVVTKSSTGDAAELITSNQSAAALDGRSQTFTAQVGRFPR